jgi:hypothetical protein
MICPPEFAQAEEARRRRILNSMENSDAVSFKNSGMFVTYPPALRLRNSARDQMESSNRRRGDGPDPMESAR